MKEVGNIVVVEMHAFSSQGRRPASARSALLSISHLPLAFNSFYENSNDFLPKQKPRRVGRGLVTHQIACRAATLRYDDYLHRIRSRIVNGTRGIILPAQDVTGVHPETPADPFLVGFVGVP
jgi:hypothetical protein